MATMTFPATRARAGDHGFYLAMAVTFIVVAFGGFLPTYWLPVAAGTFRRPPIIHIHGLMFFAWVSYYFIQTRLVSNGRTPAHRTWGMAGIALFSVMVCTVLAGQISVIRLNAAAGHGDAARRFAAVSLLQLPLLIAIFTGAIAMVRRPEVHKRLMLLLMATLMQPALARIFVSLLAPAGTSDSGPPPPFVSVPPGIVADMLIVVALVRDWRVRGRPHPVYAIGLPLVLAQQIAVVPLSASNWWMACAHAIEGALG